MSSQGKGVRTPCTLPQDQPLGFVRGECFRALMIPRIMRAVALAPGIFNKDTLAKGQRFCKVLFFAIH